MGKVNRLIEKYQGFINKQFELQQETPLANAAQHQLLDQNIHLFNGVIRDLRALAEKPTSEPDTKTLRLQSVINWVAITEKLPPEEWRDYMICLENNAIFKANYSRIGTERWLIVGVGDTKGTNPVKYWAELPSPPCL